MGIKMKKQILLMFSILFLYACNPLYAQSTVLTDDFKGGISENDSKFSDKYSSVYKELEREQNYHSGNAFLQRRDLLLQRKMYNLKAVRTPAGLSDYYNTGGFQYFGIIGGFGFNTLYSKRINKDVRMNFHIGFLSMSNRYDYNRFNPYLTNLNSSVLLIPSSIGIQRFINSRNIPKRMKVYVEAGAGPVLGINTPSGYGFFRSFSKSLYRVTPGGFAGFGTIVRIKSGYFAFADLKYHVMIFNGELGYKNNYSTPSITFGISRGLSLFH